MDCTSKLIGSMFEPKFSVGRTKTEAIIKGVIAPYAMEELRAELQTTSSVTVMVDSSNHNDLKIVPIVVRFFNPKIGIVVKLLELRDLPCETSDELSDYVFSALTNWGLEKKCVALSADNTNTNFGGKKHLGKKIFGPNCP